MNNKQLFEILGLLRDLVMDLISLATEYTETTNRLIADCKYEEAMIYAELAKTLYYKADDANKRALKVINDLGV